MQKTVELVAEMASIALDEDEWKLFVSDLQLIDESVEQLKNIQTEVENSLVFMSDATNVMRKDEVRPSLPQELVFANAPKIEENCFWVPRILDA